MVLWLGWGSVLLSGTCPGFVMFGEICGLIFLEAIRFWWERSIPSSFIILYQSTSTWWSVNLFASACSLSCELRDIPQTSEGSIRDSSKIPL